MWSIIIGGKEEELKFCLFHNSDTDLLNKDNQTNKQIGKTNDKHTLIYQR